MRQDLKLGHDDDAYDGGGGGGGGGGIHVREVTEGYVICVETKWCNEYLDTRLDISTEGWRKEIACRHFLVVPYK
jgi:hypothetical protein